LNREEVRDYSLLGSESRLAVERGLADARWYTTYIPREKMKELLVRRDGPAVRDTIIWFTLIFGSGCLFYLSWGHWYFIFPYLVYAVLFASTSDSRWHESSHGTAFKTAWMNNVLYEIASFMVFRQSVPWRWSHFRHHSDTIIRGRDPEIAVPRPVNIISVVLKFFGTAAAYAEFKKILKHTFGRIDPAVATYLPHNEYHKVFNRARIYLGIYILVVALAIVYHSILPVMFIGIPTLAGSWLMVIYGLTQHAGLAENVTDHRLNCRTVYMSRLNRYLYWNMNYHVEHHMFPLVPYHALPKLHDLMKHDCPAAYGSIIAVYKELIPALFRQSRDAGYYIRRKLPNNNTVAPAALHFVGDTARMTNEWAEVCSTEELPKGDIARFDMGEHTYAVYHTEDDMFYATGGICTHGNTHLAEGFVIGNVIECSKHNGRFNITDGVAVRQPACDGLQTYEVKTVSNRLFINIIANKGSSGTGQEKLYSFRVVSNENVTTFIKELVLQPAGDESFAFEPGDYIQLEIPAYEADLKHVEVGDLYKSKWQSEFIFDHIARNHTKVRRNYSMASNPAGDKLLKFNIRLSLPPAGQNYSAGVGSTFVFNLKEGDIVNLVGPFGGFHITDSGNEMVYIGGGAGMAPIKSHISYLFDTLGTKRKVSYWYGARSKSELFYVDYFENLKRKYPNFDFRIALSEPRETDKWDSHTGFIHQVVKDEYLVKIENIEDLQFYLCGPPAMTEAALKMLRELNVTDRQIRFDEF
jgi:Na+-transporting NADH:ubiquinone oxidoreductase subunit F